MSIFGWRWWDIGRDGRLESVNHDLWIPNEPLHAECLFSSSTNSEGHRRGEKVPVLDCHCGFWAFWDPDQASGLPHVSGYHRTTKVFGVIEAWGGIVEHELGFRCEYAIPRAVWVVRGRLHPAYEIQRYRTLEQLLAVWDVNDDSEAHS